MKFSELINKLASGQTLTAIERQEAVLEARRLEDAASAVNNWMRPGTSTMTLNGAHISGSYIESPEWVGSALHLCSVALLTPTVIPNTTETYLTPDAVVNLGGTAFTVDGDKIDWTSIKGKAFMVTGYINWSANGTGYRVAWLEGFDSNDVSIGQTPLHTFAGQNLVDNVLPVSLGFYFNDFDYLKLKVAQTSGGDLTLNNFVLGFSLA